MHPTRMPTWKTVGIVKRITVVLPPKGGVPHSLRNDELQIRGSKEGTRAKNYQLVKERRQDKYLIFEETKVDFLQRGHKQTHEAMSLDKPHGQAYFKASTVGNEDSELEEFLIDSYD
ncbi:hypothetical protein TNCV_2191 [Trichonephila clavipes]|nr:hypothetical protein TNCV_2191 [Trichonephila clavipes]